MINAAWCSAILSTGPAPARLKGVAAVAAGLPATTAVLERAAQEQRTGGASLLAAAPAISAAALDMARRFARGGRLLAFADSHSVSDAQHVAVEFVHPVLVGKRALPALAVPAHTIEVVGRTDDIALGIESEPDTPPVRAGLSAARGRGLLTIHLTPCPSSTYADHIVTVSPTGSRLAKQSLVTAYHLLWELVHVFIDQPGVQ